MLTLHPLDDDPVAPRTTITDAFIERRWLVRVDGVPAAAHVARGHDGHVGDLVRLAGLVAWTSARSCAPTLGWTTDVRPRVLRRNDDVAAQLGVGDSAPAIIIHERGTNAAGVRLEHCAIVLAAFVEQASRAWAAPFATPRLSARPLALSCCRGRCP